MVQLQRLATHGKTSTLSATRQNNPDVTFYKAAATLNKKKTWNGKKRLDFLTAKTTVVQPTADETTALYFAFFIIIPHDSQTLFILKLLQQQTFILPS